MKPLLVALILGAFAFVAAEDSSPTLLWAREFFPDRIAQFMHVVETYDGGYAVAASVPGTNGNDRPIIRFDENGNMLWYAGNTFYSQSAFWVEELSDHSFIATGGVKLAAGGSTGLFLVRVTSEGQLVWAKSYDRSTDDDVGRCCIDLPDGGFAVCGYTNDYDSWLLRTDSEGDTLWTRVWDSGNWERALRVVYHDNGLTVHVVRRVSSVPTPYLLRYSMDGELLWERSYPGLGGCDDFPGSMCLGHGNGYTFVTNDDGSNAISGTDWEGDILWQEEIVHIYSNHASSIEQTMDGGYIFSGYEGYEYPPYSLSPPAYTGDTMDGWLVKLDSLGGSQWHIQNTMESTSNHFNHAIQLSQGGYIVAGQIWDEVNSDWNGYLLRYAPETGISEHGGDTGTELILTPSSNPFHSVLEIVCAGQALPSCLDIYDITGRLVRSLSDRQGSSFLWDGRDAAGNQAPSGTYLIRGAVEGCLSTVRVVRL